MQTVELVEEKKYQPNNSYSKIRLNDIYKEFISAYEQCPVLWDTRHVHYSNQIERNNAYDVLLDVLRKLDVNATRECVKKQINSLRSNYRRLLRRHLSSKAIIDGEEVYRFIPTSWKFYALRFLDSVERTVIHKTENTDNGDIEEDMSFETSNYETVNYSESPQIHFRTKKRKSSAINQSSLHHSTLNQTTNDSQDEYMFVREVSNEEFEAIGANVSFKLRRMADEQRQIAELLINKVLINGLRNALTDESDLTGLLVSAPIVTQEQEQEEQEVEEIV